MTDQSYTHLALLVDRSGSMATIASDMNGGITQLLADQAKLPGTIRVDITTFDDKIEHPYQDVTPEQVTGPVLVPRGMTALNDALGQTIVTLGERFAALVEDDRPGTVIFVVVTDGAENASHEYTDQQVRALVLEQQERWNWQFIFLAANIDAFATGTHYGFSQAQTMQYAPTAHGAAQSFAAASAGVTRTRSGLDADFTQDERDAAGDAG